MLNINILFIFFFFLGFSTYAQNDKQIESHLFESRKSKKLKGTYFDKLLKPGEINSIKIPVKNYGARTIYILIENLEKYYEKIELASYDENINVLTLIYNHQMQRDNLINEFDKLGINYFTNKTYIQQENQ